MKLSDKILYCRKKAGLSQEALAEKLNVSRQAVSKWETGEAFPDLNNIVIIAKEFSVTTDWLLSEAEPEETPTAPPTAEREKAAPPPRHPNRNLKRSFMKYAWLIGVVISLLGIPVTIEGILFTAAASFTVNVSDVGTAFTDVIIHDEHGNIISGADGTFGVTPFGDTLFGSSANAITAAASGMGGIFRAIGIVILLIGIAMIAGGVISAVVLRKKAKRISVE